MFTDALRGLLGKSIHLRRAPRGGAESPLGRRFAGGQFLPRAMWEAEKQRAADALPGLLNNFGDKLQFFSEVYQQNAALLSEGTTKVKLMPLGAIEWRIKAAIREAYTEAFRYGKRAAGNLESVTASEALQLKKLRADEFRYLRKFLGDMRDGKGVMSYERRMDMYRAAAREAYWLGWVLGNTRPDRVVWWVIDPEAESCRDCLRFARGSPWPIQRFLDEVVKKGFLPRGGRLECKGYNCKCVLREGV